MQIRVDVANAEVVSRAFLQAPAVVMEELAATMEGVTTYLMREAQDGTPTAAGTLRSAWFTEVSVEGSQVVGRVTNPLPYALPVELGTKPHYPPIEPLINWVEQKLNLAGDEALGAALGIQRKIGRYGSPGMGMAHYALRDGRSTILAEFEECAQRITARIGSLDGGATPGAPA